MKSLIGYLLGGLFITFGALWLLWPILHGKPHSNADTYVGAGAMLLGAVLVAPANLQKALEAVAVLVPFRKGDHDDHDVNASSLPPAGTPHA